MKNLFFILVVVVAVAAEAADVVVVRGGNLWQITEAAGQPGRDWQALYAANPWLPQPVRRGGVVDVRVYPGQMLTLPASWSTGGINPAVLRVVVPPNPPAPAPQPSWWQQTQGWVQANPWVWGLLGLFGLLGLLGLRRREEQAPPAPPAPQPAPQPRPEGQAITVNVTVHCGCPPHQGGSSLIAIPRTEVTLGENCSWRTEVRHNLR